MYCLTTGSTLSPFLLSFAVFPPRSSLTLLLLLIFPPGRKFCPLSQGHQLGCRRRRCRRCVTTVTTHSTRAVVARAGVITMVTAASCKSAPKCTAFGTGDVTRPRLLPTRTFATIPPVASPSAAPRVFPLRRVASPQRLFANAFL